MAETVMDEDSNSKLPLDLSSNDEGNLPIKKRLRLETSDGEVEGNEHNAVLVAKDGAHKASNQPLTSFKGFRLINVLKENAETKTIFLEAEGWSNFSIFYDKR